MPSDEANDDDARRELEQGRQQLHTLFEFNPNGVFIIGRDGCFTSLNPACERIMGYASEELIGRPFQEVTAPESLEAAQRAFLAALAGNTVMARIMGFARDGTKRHLDMSIAPIAGEDGGSVLVMAHDVTLRVQAEAERDAIEKALRASEERYQAFISQSTEAIWRFELDEPISTRLGAEEIIDLLYQRAYLGECNDAVARMYGYERAADLRGARMADTLPDTGENRAYLYAFVESGYRLSDAESEEVDRFGGTHYFSNNLIGIVENGMLLRAWGTQRDITLRRVSEAALRAAEERYQVFIAQSTEAIWRYELNEPIKLDLPLDEQIDLVYEHAYLAECNDVMARIYGFDRAADALGRRITELLPRNPQNDAYLRAFGASGWHLSDIESSKVECDGRTHHYISNLLGIIENGHVVRAWGTRRDLTERKEVENKLRESQERLDLAIRSGNLGTWEWDLSTGLMSCSPLSRRMLGLESEDNADIYIDVTDSLRKLEAAAYSMNDAQTRERCCESTEPHLPLEMEYRTVWPDGSIHWIAVEGRLVQTAGTRPTQMFGTCRDISRRKRREMHQSVIAEASQQLAASLDLDTTLESMVRLLVPAQADWCVLDLLADGSQTPEPGALGEMSITGYTAAAGATPPPAGRRAAVAHAEAHKEQFLWQMKSLAGGDGPFGLAPGDEAQPLLISEVSSAQLELLWPDATQRSLMQAAGLHSMMCVPLRARDRVLGALIMVSCHAERRYGEDDLALAQDLARRIALAVDNARLYGQAEQARREAEAANRAKDEFLAVVSHELRTPLTPLLGWVDLINAGRLNEAQLARAFESIGRNAHAQLQLVNDLLDVSRMISGKLPLDPVPLDWREAVEAAVESIAPGAADKGVPLVWAPPEEAVMVAGDAARLRQVAVNLLANAVKFTPTGGRITVSLETGEGMLTGGGENAQLTVADTGIGIDPEFLPYVWDRFRQADTTTTRHYGGLGLGLAIVRHIVTAHEGETYAYSAGRGQGTTFRVALPLLREGVAPLDSDAREDGGRHVATAGTAVLVVDGEDDARELFTTILRGFGWDALAVPSGDEAFALLQDERWRPSVIISDLALPEMDGYEFIRRLKESPLKEIPVIALTAHAREEDRRRALEAGFARHLAKPATPTELHDAVSELASK